MNGEYEYLGNLLPDEQEKLIAEVARKYGKGDDNQKREASLRLVIPVLLAGSFEDYEHAMQAVMNMRGKERIKAVSSEARKDSWKGKW